MITNKRYIDNGSEAIEDQSFADTETDRTYYVDYFDEIIDLVNKQDKRIKELENELKLYKQYVEFVPSNSGDFDD